MIEMRDSLSKKLTAMNMLVSGVALLLAAIAVFSYDVITFRRNIAINTSLQAQIIGSNAVSPLIFNDVASAENTLSAMRVSKHIIYAGIYDTQGQFFAGYWRTGTGIPLALPAGSVGQPEFSWFEDGQFALVQMIYFDQKPAAIVYIRSDLGNLNERLKGYAVILLIILGASLAAALAVSRLSQRAISQPILKLADMAGQVSREKDYSLRALAPRDNDEVAVLVKAFNQMLREIQERDSALQESERQFRNLADSIPQLAWMAEPNGDLFWYNRRWYEFTGTTPEQMAGWGWKAVHDPELLPDVLAKWHFSLSTGQPFEMIFPLRAEDGEYRQFLTLATPVRDANGKIVRWFGTNTDITEQRRSEEALRQTEKLAATGRLAASIAHEINNPLEAVTNLVYLAQKQPANVHKYLKLADQELSRIAQITKNTLGFYRDSAALSDANISEILEEVLGLYARKLNFKNIDVTAEYGTASRLQVIPERFGKFSQI
jgi:PAS domain S-box-containing protein